MANDTYFNLRTNLLDSKLHIKNQGNVHYNVSIEDTIEVVDVFEKEIALKVKRRLVFNPSDEMELEVTFMASLQTKYDVKKEEFEADVKAGLPILNNVFSRIALTIGNMTSQSILGPMLTIPAYNMKEIIIN